MLLLFYTYVYRDDWLISNAYALLAYIQTERTFDKIFVICLLLFKLSDFQELLAQINALIEHSPSFG